MKTKRPDKISELIEKAAQSSKGSSSGDTIFDVATAIEVCRQQEDTLEQAEQLAIKSKQWSLLVQIKIENRKDPAKALEIIDKNITNIKEKVECLQLYAPKLFKAIQQAKGTGVPTSMFDLNKSTLTEQLQTLVRNIVAALVEHKKTRGKWVTEAFKHLELKDKQKVRIEDLLQIFVDDINQMKDFLHHVIHQWGGETTEKYLKELTQLNLYHRLLECYLVLNQQNQSSKF